MLICEVGGLFQDLMLVKEVHDEGLELIAFSGACVASESRASSLPELFQHLHCGYPGGSLCTTLLALHQPCAHALGRARSLSAARCYCKLAVLLHRVTFF